MSASYFKNSQKAPKDEREDSSPYKYYSIHTEENFSAKRQERWNLCDHYMVCSIDPSIKNFGFCIESRYMDGRVITHVLERVCFCSVGDEGIQECTIYLACKHFLDKFKKYYDFCHFFLIERQLPINYKSTRIYQNVLTYFTILLENKSLFPFLVDLQPTLKTNILATTESIKNDKRKKIKMTKDEVKKWAVNLALELLEKRRDYAALNVLLSQKKQDDMADTIVQSEAFFTLLGLPITKDLRSGAAAAIPYSTAVTTTLTFSDPEIIIAPQ